MRPCAAPLPVALTLPSVKQPTNSPPKCTLGGLDYGTTYHCVVRTFTPRHDDQQNDLTSIDSSPEVSATTLVTLTVLKTGTGEGSVSSTPAGINCGNDCTKDYDQDTVVSLNSVPDTNTDFGGWSGDADCDDGQVTMDADKTCTATFTNLPPKATYVVPGSVNEGSSYTLRLKDPVDFSADVTAGFEYRFDCGDGGGLQRLVGYDHTVPTCPTSDNAVRTTRGQIKDQQDATSTYTRAITIFNVAPSATFLADVTVNEGDSYDLSLVNPSDPSPVDTAAGFTYSFDCGDGYSDWSPSNTYACTAVDEGNHTIYGRIRDKDGGWLRYARVVVISNVAPTVDAGPDQTVNQADTVMVDATFTDPGVQDTHTATIDWGDGTITDPADFD